MENEKAPFEITKIDGRRILKKYIDDPSRTHIVIPDLTTAIGEKAFKGAVSIKEIIIPNSVTEIGFEAFEDCTSLISVTLPKYITEIQLAFIRCTSLTTITLPNTIKSISGSFMWCTSLTSITLPDSLEWVDGFNGCTSLAEIFIPSSVKIINWSAFEGCTSLRKVVIPNSVEQIHGEAFKNCASLIEMEIPNSVELIGSYTFANCNSLTGVLIPSSVKIIEARAFEGVSDYIRVFRSLEKSGSQTYPVDERRYRHLSSSYLITYPDPENPGRYQEVPCPLSLRLHGSNMKDLTKHLDELFLNEEPDIKPLIAFFRVRSNYELNESLRNSYLKYLKNKVDIVTNDLLKREGVDSLSLLRELEIINKANVTRLVSILIDENDDSTKIKLINLEREILGDRAPEREL